MGLTSQFWQKWACRVGKKECNFIGCGAKFANVVMEGNKGVGVGFFVLGGAVVKNFYES